MIGIKVASIVLLCTIAAPKSRANDTDDFRTLVMNLGTDLLDVFKASTYVSPRDRTDEELKETIFFNLFTKSNPSSPQILYLNDDRSLRRSHFNHRKPTRFFIHGWLGSVNAFGGPQIRDAYLAVGDYNVIIVDWNAWAKFDYTMARSYVPIVSRYLGSFIDYLESKGASLDEMIIIGHSIGAQIAGLGAKHARHEVGSVVGLDPAGPLFHNSEESEVMSKNDAKFVEIIHTNGGQLGFADVLGHADYYLNGGETQPGCLLDVFGICSHVRAYEIFAESIVNPDGFMARACPKYSAYKDGVCDSNARMRMGGERLDTSARGIFYLQSRATSPFGHVHEHDSIENGPCHHDHMEVAAHFGLHGLKIGKRCRN